MRALRSSRGRAAGHAGTGDRKEPQVTRATVPPLRLGLRSWGGWITVASCTRAQRRGAQQSAHGHAVTGDPRGSPVTLCRFERSFSHAGSAAPASPSSARGPVGNLACAKLLTCSGTARTCFPACPVRWAWACTNPIRLCSGANNFQQGPSAQARGPRSPAAGLSEGTCGKPSLEHPQPQVSHTTEPSAMRALISSRGRAAGHAGTGDRNEPQVTRATAEPFE